MFRVFELSGRNSLHEAREAASIRLTFILHFSDASSDHTATHVSSCGFSARDIASKLDTFNRIFHRRYVQRQGAAFVSRFNFQSELIHLDPRRGSIGTPGGVRMLRSKNRIAPACRAASCQCNSSLNNQFCPARLSGHWTTSGRFFCRRGAADFYRSLDGCLKKYRLRE